MELKEDFHLDYGQTTVLKNFKDPKIVEFSRYQDKEILTKSYNSIKKTSSETPSIILNAPFNFTGIHLKNIEYELEIKGTKETKKSKK
jgi:hypothetical protein